MSLVGRLLAGAARLLLVATAVGWAQSAARAEKISDFAILGSDPANSLVLSDVTVSAGLVGGNGTGTVTLSGTNQLAGVRSGQDVAIFNSTTRSTGDIVANGKFTVTGSITTGNIYSSAASSISGSSVTGNVQTGGGLSVLLNTTVKGSLYSGGNVSFVGTAPLQNVQGSVTAVGNVALNASTTIGGSLIAGGTVTNLGGIVTGAITQQAAVSPPTAHTFAPIALPAATTFTAGAQDVSIPTNGSLVLAPGSYHNLSVGSNTSVTLSSGDYFFNNFNPSSTPVGSLLTGLVKLDLTSGPINIFVSGQFSDAGSTFAVKAPGSSAFLDPFAAGASASLLNQASNVYIEAQARASNAVIVQNAPTNIFGTLYTPHGGMFFEGSDKVIGSLIGGGPGQIGAEALNVNFVPSFHLASAMSTNPFQDPLQLLDVNGDHMVTPLDALIIINELNANGAHTLTGSGPTVSGPFYDVNGDGNVSPLDALQIINSLNGQTTSTTSAGMAAAIAASSEQSPVAVPEPAGFSLALIGVLAAGLAGAISRRRRTAGWAKRSR